LIKLIQINYILLAKDSGLCQELFENHDEKPTNSFLYSLVMDSYSFGYGSTMMDMPLNQKVFLAQFDAIKKISQDGPCVIVGFAGVVIVVACTLFVDLCDLVFCFCIGKIIQLCDTADAIST